MQAELGQKLSALLVGLSPRPSLEDVQMGMNKLPAAVRDRCLRSYKEHVPFHPYYEGAYLTYLAMVAMLPHVERSS